VDPLPRRRRRPEDVIRPGPRNVERASFRRPRARARDSHCEPVGGCATVATRGRFRAACRTEALRPHQAGLKTNIRLTFQAMVITLPRRAPCRAAQRKLTESERPFDDAKHRFRGLFAQSIDLPAFRRLQPKRHRLDRRRIPGPAAPEVAARRPTTRSPRSSTDIPWPHRRTLAVRVHQQSATKTPLPKNSGYGISPRSPTSKCVCCELRRGSCN
jgi:hypothetical protein